MEKTRLQHSKPSRGGRDRREQSASTDVGGQDRGNTGCQRCMRQTDVVRQENGCSLEGLAESRIIGQAYVRGVPSRFGRKLSLAARMELANNPGAKRAVDHANRDGPDASPLTFIHARSGHVPFDDGNLGRRRLPRTHNR